MAKFWNMKFWNLLGAGVLVLSISTVADARDERLRFPIAEPMSTTTAEQFTGVRFFFGDSSHPAIASSSGTFTSRKTTNAFGKSDQTACDWAFLSAVKSLWERAHREGANAVVGIKSTTSGAPLSSRAEYECRAGGRHRQGLSGRYRRTTSLNGAKLVHAG